MNELNAKNSLITGAGIIFFGVIARFFLLKFIGIPNFEIITTLTLVSAVFLGRAWGIVVPLSIIAITDAAIGNNSVLLFTWSAFAIIGIFGFLSRKFIIPDPRFQIPDSSRNLVKRIFGMTGLGVCSAIFFYFYTNFGWWLVSNMYPHTLEGLMQSYIMGLPFFKNNLIGNLIFVPIFSGVAMFILYLKTSYLSKINSFKIKEKVN